MGLHPRTCEQPVFLYRISTGLTAQWKMTLQPRHVCQIMPELADGLVFIRKADAIHRDLKPQNGIPALKPEVIGHQFCSMGAMENGNWLISDLHPWAHMNL
jgi:hypothetical protein